jgi:hypothetical protein
MAAFLEHTTFTWEGFSVSRCGQSGSATTLT